MNLFTSAVFTTDSTSLFLGLHILLILLAFFVISWVFYELNSGKKPSDLLGSAKIGMIIFFLLLIFAWLFGVLNGNRLISLAGSENQILILFLSRIKKMFFLLLPFYSFIVYLQLGHASSVMGNAQKQKLILKIKWQVLTIALILITLIILGYLSFNLTQQLIGGRL